MIDFPFLSQGPRWRNRRLVILATAIALVMVVFVATPVSLAAHETQAQERAETAESHGATEEYAEEHGEEHGEHFHKNHLAVFIGATEAEEHHGEKGDPDFTLGVDYERRLSPLFGVGGMFDWVAEGNREFLVGPIGFLHPFGGLKLFAAPCYQHVRESGEDNFVFRTGVAWDFEIGKYSIAPNVIYDFADEQDFLVLGVTIGRGF